ncbi:GNAT family N-acetyltransferase [Agrococcus jejuensis]|uniref:Predicted acetyltransferase n=1 Tax=Agrococcus jejuensis TaxID=399736 RepID=A0A1G8ANN1_9MICO|nr:GNAT family N-acetyltransferase [Agrococcus jejuensis]SDH22568.1 Predicted acetyltransferase [Agrococcus jejuensis]
MIALVLPAHDRRDSWLESVREFAGATLHGYATFGFEADALADSATFDRWLAREVAQRTEGQDGFVPATVFWIVDDAAPERVLGSIHLRHELNDWLLADGGHVGYGIRPSARGRGVATAALALVIDEARVMGIDRLLLICDADNPASRATIVAAGGELEDVRGAYERYWIRLT